MKPLPMLATATFLLCAMCVDVFAGTGRFALYGDSEGSNCNLVDGLGLVSVYVFHEFPPANAAYAVRFQLTEPTGWQSLGFQSPYDVIGTVTNDISVSYGACRDTRTFVGSALFLSNGQVPPCTDMSPIAPDGFPSMLVADCSFNEEPLYGNGLLVNPTENCCCDCTGTEPSTWGSVKALYR